MPAEYSFFTQQIFLIGTYDEDSKHRFAPISWVSFTFGEPHCLVISILGKKQTKVNIARTNLLSATVVTPDLLPLIEQYNRRTYKKELFDQLDYTVIPGEILAVPLLKDAKYSFECEVIKTVELGDTCTYFAEIKNAVIAPAITEGKKSKGFLDLRTVNPVLYSDKQYYTIGDHLGKIGDYSAGEKSI